MSDDDIIELWEERAAIIEEGCSSDVFWKYKSSEWRRRESERLAFWQIKRLTGVDKMPRVTMQWMGTKVQNANG